MKRINRWTIYVCPECRGIVEEGIGTHLGDCPNAHGMCFVAEAVEVVPAGERSDD